jgi:hypothetical protein
LIEHDKNLKKGVNTPKRQFSPRWSAEDGPAILNRKGQAAGLLAAPPFVAHQAELGGMPRHAATRQKPKLRTTRRTKACTPLGVLIYGR